MNTSKASKIVLGWVALVWLAFRRHRGSKAEACGEDRSRAIAGKRRRPLYDWIIENGSVWIATLLRLKIFGARAAQKTWSAKMINMIGSAIFVDRVLQLASKIAADKLYADTPYFTKKRVPRVSFKDALKEFFSMTVVSSIMVSAFIVYFRIGEKPNGQQLRGWSLWGDLKKFRPLAFTAKLCCVRTIVDVMFWIGHRFLHSHKSIYVPVHKLHHEHNNPRTITNQHFTIPDFWVEALLPIVGGVVFVQSFVAQVSPFEEALLGAYVIWLEACSHAGKPLPCSTMVAPIAPVYNALFDWDRRNVEFHQCHHEMLNCNYSITQWFDHLVGTTRWKPKRKTTEVREDADAAKRKENAMPSRGNKSL